MGDGFITRRGGGIGKPLSAISVEYPIGSVCTATNGETTLTAPDTEGKVIFNVEPGTWTVTATNGTNSKTASMSIATEGEVHEVTLSYALVLFDNGAVPGYGWSGFSVGDTLTLSTWDSTGYGYTESASSASAIDMSDYNTLYFIVSTNNTNINNHGGATVGCTGATKSVGGKSVSDTRISIDVSSIDSAKITASVTANSAAAGGTQYFTLDIIKIWLE